MGREAEQLFFSHAAGKRGLLVDDTGMGGIIGVDPAYAWQIDGHDGHYLYAYTGDERADLNERRARKRFEAGIKEVVHAQEIHLKRLSGFERAAIRDRYDVGDVVAVLMSGARERNVPHPELGPPKIELLKPFGT